MLSGTHRCLLVFCLVLLVSSGSFAAPSKPTPQQIAQWVAQLGDSDFQVRENASKKLWQAGAAAEAALEKAATSDDSEVVRRARDLLDKFHWGIYPDTPADIVALIRAYQSSKGEPRREVFQQLLDKGVAGLRAVAKIIASQPDTEQRRLLGQRIAASMPAAFLRAVTEDQHAYCEQLLELGHENKFIGHSPYAAYALLRSRLPERIAHFSERLKRNPEDRWTAQALVYLHRANGELDQAGKIAEQCGRPDLLDAIRWEKGDWQALAARRDVSRGEDTAEQAAYRAAFARLAGQSDGLASALRDLQKLAANRKKPDAHVFVAAKAHLLNDRPAEGIELLRKLPQRHEMLFEILCARFEFGAALELAGKDAPASEDVPRLQLARARLLCLLDDKEGEALFDRFAQRIQGEVDPYWVQALLEEELRAGLTDRAFAHAAKALSVAPPKTGWRRGEEGCAHLYFAKLLPKQAATAEVWWPILRRQFKNETPEAVIARLRALLDGKVAAKDVKTWIEANASPPVPLPSEAFPGVRPQAWQQALAEAALRAGLDDLAVSLLKKADSRAAFIRLGDLLAAKKQWAKAAENYHQAWKKTLAWELAHAPSLDRDSWPGPEARDPMPLYLAGDALLHAGQEKEGKKLIEQAHWISCADAAMRNHFSRALFERGHHEAARREFELLARLGEPTDVDTKDAARLRAFADLRRKDYLHAADGLERSMLCCLSAQINFVMKSEFSTAPARIHRLRARALLAAGKLDEATQQTNLALRNAPGKLDLPAALVRELERRGRSSDATALFNRSYQIYESVCRAYPRYAVSHNEAAWFSVCCRRNLDAALQHAQKAVELNPRYAGYHDTLAEVYFQRGDKTKAIAEEKRALELNPGKVFFRKQLKRIQAGDTSAELPMENDVE